MSMLIPVSLRPVVPTHSAERLISKLFALVCPALLVLLLLADQSAQFPQNVQVIRHALIKNV